MKTRAFIQQFGFEELTKQLSIKVKHYPEGVTVLNYDQISTPKLDPVAMECRGLILYTGTLDVAARAFDRFFNHGEALEITGAIDFSRCKVYEKADGSLIKLWFNRLANRWEISTRGTAFAESGNDILPIFREGVLRAFGVDEEGFQTRMGSLPKELTYVLEYCAPENRIVTRYEQPQMVMLGVIDIVAGVDLPHAQVEAWANALTDAGLPCRMANSFDLASEAEILKAASELQGLQEGFVVRDMQTGARAKVKSLTYVAVHSLRGEGAVSPKRACELLLSGEHAEYLAYFPEDSAVFDGVQAKYDALIADLRALWSLHQSIEGQKEFAMAVKDSPHGALMFSTRKHPSKDPKVAFDEARLQLRMDKILA